MPLGDAVADLERAREATRRVGDLLSEINSLAGIVRALLDLAEYMNARWRPPRTAARSSAGSERFAMIHCS